MKTNMSCDIIRDKILGQGAFGKVYQGHYRNSGEKVVIKAMQNLDKLNSKEAKKWVRAACRDATYLSLVKNNGCNRCVQYINTCNQNEEGITIIMEYLGAEEGWIDIQTYNEFLHVIHAETNGSLHPNYNKLRQRFGELIFHRLFVTIASYGPLERLIALYNYGMATLTLHNIGIIHHDMKPANAMINVNTLDVKLIDFGAACVFTLNGRLPRGLKRPSFILPCSEFKFGTWWNDFIGSCSKALPITPKYAPPIFEHIIYNKGQGLKGIAPYFTNPETAFAADTYTVIYSGLFMLLRPSDITNQYSISSTERSIMDYCRSHINDLPEDVPSLSDFLNMIMSDIHENLQNYISIKEYKLASLLNNLQSKGKYLERITNGRDRRAKLTRKQLIHINDTKRDIGEQNIIYENETARLRRFIDAFESAKENSDLRILIPELNPGRRIQAEKLFEDMENMYLDEASSSNNLLSNNQTEVGSWSSALDDVSIDLKTSSNNLLSNNQTEVGSWSLALDDINSNSTSGEIYKTPIDDDTQTSSMMTAYN